MAKKNDEHLLDATEAEAPAPTRTKTKYNLNNLNTLSVVSIATALTGFGAVAGVITGHVALSQLKSDGKDGRGLALAGMIIGYVGVGIAVISAAVKLALGVWGIRNGVSFGDHQMGGNFGNNFGGGFGQHGGFGQDDQNGGMMGQWGSTDQQGQNGPQGMNGFGGGMIQIQPNTGGTVTTPGQNN